MPVAAGGVIALVEDQVHDRADGPDPVGKLVVGWESERDGCCGDLAFGPDHCCKVRQGPGRPGAISAGASPATARRVSDLSIDPQGRMAAHQDQRQLVITAAARWPTLVDVGLAVDRLQPGQQLGPLGPAPVAAEPVGRAAGRW